MKIKERVKVLKGVENKKLKILAQIVRLVLSLRPDSGNGP
jgi:hypothetical protein